MKRTTWIVLGWLVLVLAISAQAASFDCEKAATKVEKLICGDRDISKLDEELSAAYKAALQDKKQAESIRQAQKQWMKVRNGCADATCVKSAYESRLQAMSTREQSARTSENFISAQIDKTQSAEQEFPQEPPKLRYGLCDRNKPELFCEGPSGKGYSICEAYLQHLQTLTSPPTCEAPIPPGFKQPDWEEMDVMQHLDLAYQAEEFFLKKFGGYKHPDFDTWRQTFLQEIKNGKITPRMRKAKVMPNDKGEATILAYTRDKDACHKSYGSEERQVAKADRRLGLPINPYWSSQGNAGQLWVEQGNVHFMLPGDTPPTLQVIAGNVSRTKTDLLLYSGRPYFVRIIREHRALYRSRDEQAHMAAGMVDAQKGLVDGKQIIWMDNSPIAIYAFDPRFPDARPNLDLNHYLADKRCQFMPY
jgi:uncharacterized protein